jgi:hypothetical protein
MPCDYSLYPQNWDTEIRPAILERDGHRCKICRVKNYEYILRGEWHNLEAYQDAAGNIHSTANGEKIGDQQSEIDNLKTEKAIKVVLTIAHLDHNTENNNYDNLAALCQLHHLRHDKGHHMENSRATREKKRGLQRLF